VEIEATASLDRVALLDRGGTPERSSRAAARANPDSGVDSRIPVR
jgi:hypothetical protein